MENQPLNFFKVFIKLLATDYWVYVTIFLGVMIVSFFLMIKVMKTKSLVLEWTIWPILILTVICLIIFLIYGIVFVSKKSAEINGVSFADFLGFFNFFKVKK